MRKKDFVFWIVFVLAIGGIIFSFQHRNLKEKISKKELISAHQAALIIDYGNGKKRVFKGEAVEGLDLKTLIDLLTEEKKITSKFRKTQKGFVLESLEGLKNDSKSWKCYLNGNLIEKDFEKIFIHPGDQIELVYE